MNKKRLNTKVLMPLSDGFSIREIREFHTDTKTDKTTQTGSSVAVFQGKKVIEKGFKNTQAAFKYFEEVAK